MASDDESKVKDTAQQSPEVENKAEEPSETAKSPEANEPKADPKPEVDSEPEKDSNEESKADAEKAQPEDTKESQDYKWCKCFCEPAVPGAQNFYFLHTVTQESSWEEPKEPFWLWDTANGTYDASGLQPPSSQLQQGPPGTSSVEPSSEQDPDYYGYNPAIHGSYDPTAPYAQYHNRRRDAEKGVQEIAAAGSAAPDYSAQGTFNRFTGAFQNEDKSAERHNDFNKSGRQLNSFFDVDAAANAHGGKSLKEERRNQKLTKKEIAELTKKRRDKKEKKRMDFYKS